MNTEKIAVTDIIGVCTVFSKKGRMEKMQTRPSYGLSFTNDGQITYIKDGKSYISDKTMR